MSANRFFITTLALVGVCAFVTGCGDSVTGPVAPPQNVIVSQTASGSVILRWDPSPQNGLVGYNIYRRDLAEQQEMRLTSTPIQGTWFQDTTSRAGHVYAYRVTAVTSKSESAHTIHEVEILEHEPDKRDLLDG